MLRHGYLIGFLLAAGLLMLLGRNELPFSVFTVWGLVFGATTAVGVLLVTLVRVQQQLQVSRHELARKDAELSFALEVQKALFPRQLPEGSGLEFSAVCIPARGISGDYYDIMQLPGGKLLFAVADISGKGISAAILMAHLQALLRTVAETSHSPQDVCARLNNHLYRVTEANKFATLFLGEWDYGRNLLNYINAGHLSPILIGSNGGQRLTQGGVPLGLFPDIQFEMGRLHFNPGDLMVLYSDGIVEAESPGGEQFGDERLEQLVETVQDAPLAEIQLRILESIREWSPNDPEDDMTIMIIRRGEEP